MPPNSDIIQIDDVIDMMESIENRLGQAPSMRLDSYVEIVEQPAKTVRYRYQVEGNHIGSIPGISSTADHRTHPAIKIHNYVGPAKVMVVLVTSDRPYRVHPHGLTSQKNCKDGLYVKEVIVKEDQIIHFAHLGIQVCKMNDLQDSLKRRSALRIDPFGAGYAHADDLKAINRKEVRLCFQVFLPSSGEKAWDSPEALKPVASSPIFDEKYYMELKINKLSHSSGPAEGGLEMILLCERVNKDDIEIHFFEKKDGQTLWTDNCPKGRFTPKDVYKQFAITFRTPTWTNIKGVDDSVEVEIRLYQPSASEYSDPVDFIIKPEWNPKRKMPKTLHPSLILSQEKTNHEHSSPPLVGCSHLPSPMSLYPRPVTSNQSRVKRILTLDGLQEVSQIAAQETFSPLEYPVDPSTSRITARTPQSPGQRILTPEGLQEAPHFTIHRPYSSPQYPVDPSTSRVTARTPQSPRQRILTPEGLLEAPYSTTQGPYTSPEYHADPSNFEVSESRSTRCSKNLQTNVSGSFWLESPDIHVERLPERSTRPSASSPEAPLPEFASLSPIAAAVASSMAADDVHAEDCFSSSVPESSTGTSSESDGVDMDLNSTESLRKYLSGGECVSDRLSSLTISEIFS